MGLLKNYLNCMKVNSNDFEASNELIDKSEMCEKFNTGRVAQHDRKMNRHFDCIEMVPVPHEISPNYLTNRDAN